MFAYDYPWPVDYRFKINSQDEVNSVIEKFIYDNPEFQVYKIDLENYSADDELKDEDLQLCLSYVNREPFGIVLRGNVFLNDVNSDVGFSILPIKQSQEKEIIIRLNGYSKKLDIITLGEKTVVKKWQENFSFNDVEPTQQEIPIKESFEKNFLERLPIECEYVDPGNLDRIISKILTVFRKNKFVILFCLCILIVIFIIIKKSYNSRLNY